MLEEILALNRLEVYTFRRKYDIPTNEELLDSFVSFSLTKSELAKEIISKYYTVTEVSTKALKRNINSGLVVVDITVTKELPQYDDPRLSFQTKTYVKSLFGKWFYIDNGRFILQSSRSLIIDIEPKELHAVHVFTYK